MSLKYYLFWKKQYDEVIRNLEYIILSYDEFNDYSVNTEKNYFEFLEQTNNNNNKNFFIKTKNHIEELKKRTNNIIYNLCCHQIIEDTIDITPDKSVNIRYCSICEYTFTD